MCAAALWSGVAFASGDEPYDSIIGAMWDVNHGDAGSIHFAASCDDLIKLDLKKSAEKLDKWITEIDILMDQERSQIERAKKDLGNRYYDSGPQMESNYTRNKLFAEKLIACRLEIDKKL